MRYSDEELAILIPALGRPHTIKPVYNSARRATPNARVLFLVSSFDKEVHEAIKYVGGEMLVVPYNPVGDYARKINAGYEYTDEPLLFTGATDIVFYPYWFEHAAKELERGAHVVGTNDLGHEDTMNGTHSTHSLVKRSYVDRYGLIDGQKKLLCEEYVHEFVDDELVGTAKFRNVWGWSKYAVVEHLHPTWKKAATDEQYEQQSDRMQGGSIVYQLRKPLWTLP